MEYRERAEEEEESPELSEDRETPSGWRVRDPEQRNAAEGSEEGEPGKEGGDEPWRQIKKPGLDTPTSPSEEDGGEREIGGKEIEGP
jgi:hypothetical protein